MEAKTAQRRPGGLARAIRIVRAARGMKSQEVEKAVGVRPGYLSQIENGTRRPRPETVRRLEQALRISQTSLVFLSLDKEERDKMGDAVAETLSGQVLRELIL